ncbi:MAG: hypothetical protein AABW58_01795 [Nanoarchaeota archaeon]
MSHIYINFAHGNGPFSRMVDFVISYNNQREALGLQRLPAVFPLIPSYAFKGKEPGSRQKQFMKEIAEEAAGKDFLEKHPSEFLLDLKVGALLDKVFFKGSDYEEALKDFLVHNAENEEELKKLIENEKRELETLTGEKVAIDLKDTTAVFDFNNRIRLQHQNAFYMNAGAGYFSEVLSRALSFPEVQIDPELIQKVIPLAGRLTDYQKLHFVSDPGVFSYVRRREKQKPTELSCPPQMHVPKLDTTELPKDGIYVVVTGIQGLAESGFYDIAKEMGLQIYSSDDNLNNRVGGIKHPPFKIANQRIKAQIARTGWSSVWSIHMLAEHGLDVGLLFPSYKPKDDPEIIMNNHGVERLELGVEIDFSDPKKSLEKAVDRARFNRSFNQDLKEKYGTLDGIDYMAETIFMHEQGKDISDKLKIEPY